MATLRSHSDQSLPNFKINGDQVAIPPPRRGRIAETSVIVLGPVDLPVQRCQPSCQGKVKNVTRTYRS